MERIVNLYI